MAVTFNKFNSFVEDLAEKVHNLGSDTLKLMLSNTAPVATNTTTADITEISAGNGYSAGGLTLTASSSSQTSGTYKLVLGDVTLTASGGSIATFRYAILYNSTASNKLIAWYDRGAALDLASGDSWTADFDATNGAIQVA